MNRLILALPVLLCACGTTPDQTAANVTNGVVTGNETVCQDYTAVKPAAAVLAALAPATAATITSLEAFGDSACSATGVLYAGVSGAWLGNIAGQIQAIVNPPKTS